MPDSVSAALMSFPGPVTFNASRKKWVFTLMGAIVFVGLSAFFLQFDEFPVTSRRGTSWPFFRTVFWVGIVFFGIGILMSVTMIIPGASRITLDQTGFEITKFFRSRRVAWRDATDFQTFIIQVVFDEANRRGGTMAALNASLSGRNSYLPDTYGWEADDLARLMTLWRERALR